MQPNPSVAGTGDQTWHDIFTNPHHTGQTWACVAAAIAHADDVLRHTARTPLPATDPSHPRGGPLWAQAAVSSYHLLTSSGAYQHHAPDRPGEFVADHAALHTWLTAPNPRGVAGRGSVADQLGVGAYFTVDDEDRPGRVARLIDAAQTAGVLRCPTAGVELWHIADDNGDVIGHRLAVHQRTVILASEQFDLGNLIDETLGGIPAATALLTYAAEVASRVLTPSTGGTAAGAHTPGYDRPGTPEPPPVWAQGFPIGYRQPHTRPNPPTQPAHPQLTADRLPRGQGR